MTEPCCDTLDSDPHSWGECMLGSPSPGDDRRAYLREQERAAEGKG